MSSAISPAPSSIAVIVVNYGTATLAISAVESVLERRHGGRSVEIHLVDNASPNGDAALLREAHLARGWGERVTLHLEQENHGFGRGNNVVLGGLIDRDAAPEAVVLLNPDAQLENEAIDRLARELDAHPETGFAGAGIAMPNGAPRSAAFRFPSMISEFSQTLDFGPVSRALSRWQVPLPPNHPAGEVDWLAGAALMIRTETLRRIGLFDPDFFLYYEEVELMWRGRRAGWSCRYVPEARVVHEEGAATGVKSSRDEPKRHPIYRYESWKLYHLKTRGRGAAMLTAAATLAGAFGNRAIAGLRRRPAGPVPYFIGDFWCHAACPILTRQEGRVRIGQADPFAPTIGAENGNPTGIGFWALVAEDYRTNDRDFGSQGLWTLFWHRFGNWRMSVRPKVLRAPLTVLYRIMYKLCQLVCGIMLPYTVRVGRRVRLDHFGGMILVAHTIGDDVIVRQNTTFGIAGLGGMQDRPIIENGVEIGAGAVVLGRIRIGTGARIGANAVVVRDVPPGAVVGGVPARIIRPGPET